jgi:uncharacterized low-complexity protein
MTTGKVTALVLAVLIAGLVLGSFGIANATSKATDKPAAQACQQGDCTSALCPGDPAKCDKSQCGSGDCVMKRAATQCGSGNCDTSGVASGSKACGSGPCGAKQ